MIRTQAAQNPALPIPPTANPLRVRLPAPHPGQRTVLRQARRFSFLAAGRRWRKTTLLMAIAVERALRGQIGIWGAPTYDQVRIGWREMYRAVGGVAQCSRSTMTVTYPTNGMVIFRSLDQPDNARGHTAQFVLLDEAADIAEEAWYEVLRPMLVDTGGHAWVVGTPKGHNWFWREWTAAATAGDPDMIAWQVPTLGCRITPDGELLRQPHPLENPDISWSEIERLYHTVSAETFRQEVLAEFLEGAGTVFRRVAEAMTAPLQADPAAHSGHTLVAGLDWGRQRDFTAISVGCATCRVELARDRFNQIDFAFQRARIRALLERWGQPALLAESNSIGEPNLEQLHREGLRIRGFETTAASKPPLIENLALVLERGEWAFQADPVWTAELEAYERKVNSVTGRSTYSAPHGIHDDTVMARALMVWQARNKGVLLA